MYWSACVIALVPPGVVTVTSTMPTVPGGTVTVSEVPLFATILAPGAVPNRTEVALVNPLPVTVTVAPPPTPPAVMATTVSLTSTRTCRNSRCAADGLAASNAVANTVLSVAAPVDRTTELDALLDVLCRELGGVRVDA